MWLLVTVCRRSEDESYIWYVTRKLTFSDEFFGFPAQADTDTCTVKLRFVQKSPGR